MEQSATACEWKYFKRFLQKKFSCQMLFLELNVSIVKWVAMLQNGQIVYSSTYRKADYFIRRKWKRKHYLASSASHSILRINLHYKLLHFLLREVFNVICVGKWFSLCVCEKTLAFPFLSCKHVLLTSNITHVHFHALQNDLKLPYDYRNSFPSFCLKLSL